MIKIDKGVPMPPPAPTAERYPFKDMGVGDSFFVPTQKAADENRVRGAATSHAHRARTSGRIYGLTVRRVTEGGVRGVRVWRTA